MALRRRRLDKETKALVLQYAPDAKHPLRRKTGDWYHELEEFPGVFFDATGFIRFKTEVEYKKCSQLKHGQTGDQIRVIGGIKIIPGYKYFPN